MTGLSRQSWLDDDHDHDYNHDDNDDGKSFDDDDIKDAAGKTDGKADGRGCEDGRRALQASHGAKRLDWKNKV